MTIKTAKIALTALWGVCAIPLLLVLVLRQLNGFYGKRGKTGGGMNLRFTGGHESDSFWECCRPPTSMAYRMPI